MITIGLPFNCCHVEEQPLPTPANGAREFSRACRTVSALTCLSVFVSPPDQRNLHVMQIYSRNEGTCGLKIPNNGTWTVSILFKLYFIHNVTFRRQNVWLQKMQPVSCVSLEKKNLA